MGIQNYYCIANNIYNNLTKISYAILPSIRIQMKHYGKKIEFQYMAKEFKEKLMVFNLTQRFGVLANMHYYPSLVLRE